MIPGVDQIGITNIQSLFRYCQRFAKKYRIATYLDADDLMQEVLIARAINDKPIKAKYAIWKALRPTFPVRDRLVKHVAFREEFMGGVNYGRLIDNYIDFSMAFSRIDNERGKEALLMLLAGYDLNEIGEFMGCTHQNVSYLLRTTVRDSLNPQSVKNKIKVERQTTADKIRELSRLGMSQNKIAQEIGCSKTKVYRTLKKLNVGQSAVTQPSPLE